MPRTASPRRQLISLADAAEYLGVNKRTIFRFISDGKLPAYRVGSTIIRVDQADVDAIATRIPTGGAVDA